MTTIKNLRAKALHNYSLHIGYSWLISIFGCLICAGILFVFSYFTSIVLLPSILLVLPIMFATICSHRALHFKKEPEFKRTFTYFKAFFSREFLSSFNFVFSLLKSFLVGIIAYAISFPIVYFSFKNTSGTFETTMQSVVNMINSLSFTTEQLEALVYDNDYELLRFIQILMIPSSSALFIAMFFFVSVSSFSIYNRFEADPRNMPFAINMSKITIKNHRKEFYKYYFGLNWPMYVIIILFAGLGSFLSYCLNGIDRMPMTLILPICVAGLIFFYPFFLNNNEVIFEEFTEYYKETAKIMSDDLLKAINEEQSFNEEQRQIIEDALKKLNGGNQDVSSETDKEKDPPNSES